MVVSIVGLGLIGGSMAMDLKAGNVFSNVYGVDNNSKHSEKALELGLVDDIISLNKSIEVSDLIILAIPVDAAKGVLLEILNRDDCPFVMDVGSTKGGIIEVVKNNLNRRKFVATHPMSGTENSGPGAAIAGLFKDKLAIICDEENSESAASKLVRDVYLELGSVITSMDSGEHDTSAAYVSHISHISSFALALTVLNTEKDKQNILKMASGGFRTTVRLANSNAKTWAPILIENKKNVLPVLDTYIEYMNELKSAIELNDEEGLKELMISANRVKRIIEQPK